MNLSTISTSFNRALFLTFERRKLLLVFCILALCGLLAVFFRGLSWNAGYWVQLSLMFLPVFLCGGILLSTGILLVRIYHDEIKNREISYKEIINRSWEVIIGASYFAVPIVITYLLLWMLLGIFLLLKGVPAIGDFISAVLAFAPFLINLASLILCLGTLVMLFLIAPIIALKSLERLTVFEVAMRRLEKDPFLNLLFLLIALIPMILVAILLTGAALLTKTIYLDWPSQAHTILTWFFIMLPFTAFLTPAVIFFFNFAAEAHVLMQKQMR